MTTQPPDDRGNLPSASYIERITLCPGSWALESTLPESPSTKDAESGSRIHAALAGKVNPDTLTDDEAGTYVRCAATVIKICNELGWGRMDEADEIIQDQRRFWLHDITMRPICSALPDLVLRWGDRVLIVDYKTGRDGATEAPSNWQLRTQVACVAEGMLITEAVVAIVQPWCSPQYTLSRYSRADIIDAIIDVETVVKVALSPNQPRIPGEKQCRYCRGAGVCPEAQGRALVPASPMLDRTPEAQRLSVELMPTDKLEAFLDAVPFAERVFDAAKDEMKRRLKAGEESRYYLKPGAIQELISDPQTVFQRFTAAGGTAEQYLACVKVKKGELKEQLRSVTGEKGKGLEAAMKDLLLGCTEKEQNEPSLARRKE